MANNIYLTLNKIDFKIKMTTVLKIFKRFIISLLRLEFLNFQNKFDTR